MSEHSAIDEYFRKYAQAATDFDADASASLWGIPGTILDDRNVVVAETREKMKQGLQQSHPIQRKLGLASVSYELLETSTITDAVGSAKVRWLFHDAAGDLLTDGSYFYVLRRDADGYHAYFSVSIDATEKLMALAKAKNIDL